MLGILNITNKDLLIICYVFLCSAVVIRDGNWGDWEAWSACSATCGDGRNLRVRYCNNPTPMNGLTCSGDALELETCNDGNCTGTGPANGFALQVHACFKLFGTLNINPLFLL